MVLKIKNISSAEVSTEARTDVLTIGQLSFVQLAELRHRGAFSSVAQTFAACCQTCLLSQDAGLNELPSIWYEVRVLFRNLVMAYKFTGHIGMYP